MSKAKNVVSIKSENTKVAAFDMSKLRVVKQLVLPTLSIAKMKEGDELFIKITSEIRKVEQIDPKTEGVKVDKAGTPILLPLVNAINLQNGETGQMVLPAIVYRAMAAEGIITGRMFALKKGNSLGAGKANLWDVVEISDAE